MIYTHFYTTIQRIGYAFKKVCIWILKLRPDYLKYISNTGLDQTTDHSQEGKVRFIQWRSTL